MTTTRITPPEKGTLDRLHDEAQAHMERCQTHYKRALRVYDQGGAPQHYWNLAMMEALGAIMCQQQINAIMTAILVAEGSDVTEAPPEVGGMAS
jgi:hypothetical protein